MTEHASRVLVNCQLLDVNSAEVHPDQGIWVKDGRIQAVGSVDDVVAEARSALSGTELADLGGDYVLPGLMNLHVHLGLTHSSGTPDRTPAARALRMGANARHCLGAGVTTVRLVGESDRTDFDLREAIRAGHCPGPRILTAGQALCCTGGHGSGFDAIELDGPSGFARGVRQQVGMGAEVIKICISGGIGGVHERIRHSQLTEEEIRAAVQVAHGWGRLVTAHAGPADVISSALDCGLDGVEHGYGLDVGVVKKMAARRTWLVPTLCVSRCEAFYKRLGAPSYVLDKALGAGEGHLAGISSAIREGVPIALGTDMLPFEEFDDTTATVRELEFLVQAGHSPAAALRAATTEAARYLGLSGEVGNIAVGQAADLIAVAANPLHDISRMRQLTFVMHAGCLARPEPHGRRST